MRGSGPAFAVGAAICAVALGIQARAPAEPLRCFGNGDVVTFGGIASPGARGFAWVLNLSRPICVMRDLSSGGTDISAIRIIGTPPPLGVPLELTGKLLLGRSVAESRLFVALVVTSGRKVHTTESIAPVQQTAPAPRTPPAPQGAPMRGESCNVPPYGGTAADYNAFVQRFGRIVRPEKILAGVCNAKFGNAPRDGLHKLGFTDARINSESTEHLAAETIAALKNLVNTIE
ncbi:MAG TPA: hypothetical protein VIY09_07335 [Rhizomicrobium sp.]